MEMREHLLPRRLFDFFSVLLMIIFLPICFIYEVIVVLPAFHEPGGLIHTFTCLLAGFMLFNIKSNLIASILVDTSVDFKSIKSPEQAESLGWRYCKDCDGLAPPRSWHCKVCRGCILKRKYHYCFMGCCVGHKNQRFYMIFVFFLFAGTMYAFVYNTVYLWILNADLYCHWLSVLKMICPLVMLVPGMTTWNDVNLLVYNVNILIMLFSLLLLLFSVPAALKGGISYEHGKGYAYNNGWKSNLKDVFGRRMHLVWLSPFIESELPHDGINWKRVD